MIGLTELVIGILAVWRITYLLHAEGGPAGVLTRFRRRLGTGFWGQLVGCFYCLSLWVAAPFAYLLGASLQWKLLLWPALSAGAIVVHTAVAGRGPVAVHYFEEKEHDV